jgi:hypothetical protein
MANTTIQVTTEVRDHLAAVAAERGTTIGALVAELGATQLTREQLAERQAAGRAAMRTHLEHAPSDGELDAMPNVLERLYTVAAEHLRSKDTAA